RFGLSDTEQRFFLSPAQSLDGITWGVGPVFLWPTATSSELGTGKWGAGPTGVILKQHGGWTYGALANHIWSYAGHSDRE
ncbi:transporter, partial [Paraburkholderia sp. SIMBA_061]